MTVKSIHIKNFKSIVDLSLDLGDINVFIGENGSGKSNILEALAFGSAAAADKLDNEFLVSRGIRVTDVRFMRSAFGDGLHEPIAIDFIANTDQRISFQISADLATPYPRWEATRNNAHLTPLLGDQDTPAPPAEEQFEHSHRFELLRAHLGRLGKAITESRASTQRENASLKQDYISTLDELLRIAERASATEAALFLGFVIFSPENTALRTFEREGQITPLGIHGEGLLKLLRVLATEDPSAWEQLRENLRLLDWFAAIELDHEVSALQQSIKLRDRFLSDALPAFDQRSANEGFLYLLFFFALVLSNRTPHFFAIENIDTSLNPKACSELMTRLATLSIERKKQVLITTHNPSLLDGLNLHDDRQRLFVVSRNRDGHTIVRRIHAPQPVGNELPIRLSEAFTRGLLGGLPRNF